MRTERQLQAEQEVSSNHSGRQTMCGVLLNLLRFLTGRLGSQVMGNRPGADRARDALAAYGEQCAGISVDT
jgi:hypothetical protein